MEAPPIKVISAGIAFPFSLRNCYTDNILFRLVGIHCFAKNYYTGRKHKLLQLAAAKVIVILANRDIVLAGEIIRHSEKIQGFGIPFLFVKLANLIRLEQFDDKGNISEVFDLVANIAFEHIEGGAHAILIHTVYCRRNRTFHRNIQYLCDPINELSD